MKISIHFLEKYRAKALQVDTHIDPVILLWGIYPKWWEKINSWVWRKLYAKDFIMFIMTLCITKPSKFIFGKKKNTWILLKTMVPLLNQDNFLWGRSWRRILEMLPGAVDKWTKSWENKQMITPEITLANNFEQLLSDIQYTSCLVYFYFIILYWTPTVWQVD